MADADLTLDRLQEVIEKLENLRLVGDVQSYLRLGEENFRSFKVLSDGGVLAVPDRETADQIAAIAKPVEPGPSGAFGIRVAVLDWLPPGVMLAVSSEVWRVRQQSRIAMGTPPELTT